MFRAIKEFGAGEEMNCVRESTNSEDPFAVAVMHRSGVVGHIP